MPTPNVDGLDISHWNVVTDENAIPRMPLMSCKATEGSAFVSPKFSTFWAMFARLEARYRGAYHWVRSTTSMKSQVDHLARNLDKVGGLKVGDFIQLDWETTPGIPNVTVGQIEEWLGLAVEEFGERDITYGSDWVPGFTAWRARNPGKAIWYANYNIGDKPTGGWAESVKYHAAVWQWSSTSKVPGFLWNPDEPTDGIDVNHVFDWATLDRLTLRTDTPAPIPVPLPGPIPVPVPPEEDEMKAILYTVADPAGNTVWFYVSPERTVATLESITEPADLVAAGALERDVDVDVFRLQLRTFQPLGFLNAVAENLLGPEASADWKARATPGATTPGGVVPFPLKLTGTIAP